MGLATQKDKYKPYLASINPFLEPIDKRERDDPILGERTLIVRPGADFSACGLHIRYIDNAGLKRTQVFDIVAEGPKDACLPHTLHFTYREIHHMVANPEYAWTI